MSQYLLQILLIKFHLNVPTIFWDNARWMAELDDHISDEPSHVYLCVSQLYHDRVKKEKFLFNTIFF